MTRIRIGVSVMLAGLLLLALAVGAQAKQGGNGNSNGLLTNKSLRGRFSFRLVPATSFAPFYDGTAGKPDSGVATAPRQDILRVGVFTADGAGNLTGRMIATTDDGLTTVIIDFTFSGTYTVNSDGTGNLAISPTVADSSCTPAQPAGVCATFEGDETYAFVLNNHGEDKLVSLIQTDNVGGGAKIFLTGEAKRQGGESGSSD